MTTLTHHEHVAAQFNSRARAYLTSNVHAQGADLTRLSALLADFPEAHVLDIGSGAGHASFAAAPRVARVTAWDLSQEMLEVVAQSAQEQGLTNIETRQGMAEKLILDDACIDIVITRYSAHHWHDAGVALREAQRVLKPGGMIIVMDVISPGRPVYDIWLQTIEALRDTSHVRNYSAAEWGNMLSEAGFSLQAFDCDKLELAFTPWIERMRTPPVMVNAIRAWQESAASPIKAYFQLKADGSFTSDTGWFQALKM